MKRLFFLLTMCVCVSIWAWAGPTVTRDDSIVTINTDGNDDLSNANLIESALMWGCPNGIVINGAIKSAGFDAIISAISGNGDYNNKKGNISLDISGATLNADVSSFSDAYGTVVLPSDVDPQSYTYQNEDLKYAISIGETITYVQVGDGISLSEIPELTDAIIESTASGHKIMLSGEGADELKAEIDAKIDLGNGVKSNVVASSKPYTIRNTVDASGNNVTTIFLKEGGVLEDAIAELNSSDKTYDNLIVNNDESSALTAADVASLSSLTNTKNIFMPNAVLSNEAKSASFSFVNNTTIENIVLPMGLDPSPTWFNGCSNLNAAVSYSSDGKTMNAHVNKPGTLRATMDAFKAMNISNPLGNVDANNYNLSNLENIKFTGILAESDLARATTAHQDGTTGMSSIDECALAWAGLKNVDISGATLENDDVLKCMSSYNETLERAYLPQSAKNIPAGAFYSCTLLSTVNFSSVLETIGNNAFNGCGLTEIMLPSSIKSVGAKAFYSCPLLENVEMQPLDGSCTFGEQAFASCKSLKHVSLSEGVDGISNKMFYACGQLESIRVPTSCKIIRSQAFELCFSLHTFVIPEGVDLLEKSVFDNAGLTDVYVMATSYDKIPKIYDIGKDGNDTGTFSKKNLAGNNTDPRGTHKDDIGDADDETVLSYYQEEFSDKSLGLGGGNCMVQLHYPETMSWFYNNVNIETLPYSTWKNNVTGVTSDAVDFKLDGKTFIYEGYALGSQEYGHNAGDSWPRFGPSESDKYWPTQTDYAIRLASGYTEGDIATAEAWRQFPLQGFAKINDETFTKKYDDTWYTMCFPWDMDDNTLFSTFNQKCEITEFVGVEVFKDDNAATENVVEYSMVFHFDHVAPTYYMDEDHNEYERVTDYTIGGRNTTRTEQISQGGVTIEKKYYTYKSKNGSEYIYWPFNTDNLTDDEKEMRKKYNDIKHLIVFAGRPYMIHPSIGAKTGQPKDCTVAGVQKVTLAEGETWDTYADKKKIEQKVTTNGTFQNPGTTLFVNPETNKGGSYFFIGNIGDEAKDMLNDERKMAYFLAVAEGEVYPKYYRKTSGGLSKWSQYSAIIYPDKDALDNVEGLDGMRVSSASGSKAFDVAFGEWEIVTPTAIEEVIADAEKSEKPMKQVHMNVVVNINGQVVRQGTSVEGLPKGLYIINGKKYMVK